MPGRERLDYPLLGREVLQDAAAQLGRSGRGRRGEDGGTARAVRPDPLITKLYVAAVRAALVEHARDGNLVYHGLAGGLLLRSLPGVLCVRLIAPLEIRVRALMESHGMDEDSAEAYIREVDDARARWVKDVYGEDILDSALYDMVLEPGELLHRRGLRGRGGPPEQPEFEMTPTRHERAGATSDWRARFASPSWKTWGPRPWIWRPRPTRPGVVTGRPPF